jgi:hypothetical protein
MRADFIGVDSQFVADTSTRARVGGVPKRQWVRQLLAEKIHCEPLQPVC